MSARQVNVHAVIGDEELLVERAIASAVRSAHASTEEHSAPDVTEVSASALVAGQLAEITSPSLFGDRRVLVLRDAEQLPKELLDEVTGLCRDIADGAIDDVVAVLVHAGGARGRAVLDAALGFGARRLDCVKLTKAAERVEFIRAEISASGRTINEDGARALLEAVGNDLRELAAACGQLSTDTEGRLDATLVSRYYRGRAEASGFVVADRAIEGKLGEALEGLRWALAIGTAPVLVASALAQGLRALAKVGSAPRGLRVADLAREVGLPPWKVDRVKAQLRGWSPDGVATAIRAVAEADAQVKGGGTDASYALEKAVMAVIEARNTAAA